MISTAQVRLVRVLVTPLLLVVPLRSTQAESTFENLGFESVTIVPVPGDQFRRVEFGPAVPGWTGFIGNERQDLILYNNMFLGSPGIALLGTGWNPIEGAFSLMLQAGELLNSPDVSVAQFGLIPSGTEALVFRCRGDRGSLTVAVNGETVPLTVLETHEAYSLYSGDISEFAGQNAELKFTNPSIFGKYSNVYLDSITFATVPEPSTLGLLGVGIAGLLVWRRQLSN